MTDPFADPAAPSEGVTWKELNNVLLLLEPLGVEEGIKTVHGESSAVRANVVELDGPNAGTEHTDTLVFPKLLQGQLKSRIGQKVLGRLGQGNAKPGQSAPWILQAASDADKQLGARYLASTQTSSPAPPF